MASDQPGNRYHVDINQAQGPVIGDNPIVNQYFYGQAQPTATPVSSWLGRHDSLGNGFFGRQADLDTISNELNGKRAVVISGGAGCGKSRLAAEYTHLSKASGFWSDAGENPVHTLAALAAKLGIGGNNEAEIANEMGRALATLPQETIWVIDNLGDLNQVNGLLSVSGSVRLLLTTRDTRSYMLAGNVGFIPLEVIDADPAIALLCSRSNFDPANASLSGIVEAVGRLPLALEMLAVRLAMPTQTPERLLADLQKAPTTIEFERFQVSEGASISRPDGVFATIAGTLADLPEEVREAISGLGYIADAPVPLPLFAAITGLDESGLDTLYQECAQRSVLPLTGGI